MRKKILIFVLSADFPPYDSLMKCQQETWDSGEVENCETVYYCDRSEKENIDKVVYFPVDKGLKNMGRKDLLAYEWALQNKEFDYMARPHSCMYVNKRELVNYVETLPSENVFSSLRVEANPQWAWFGIGAIFSRDVVQKIVENQHRYNHTLMEDMATSHLMNDLKIPYIQGRGCSIDKLPESWRCTSYGTESFLFDDFADIVKAEGQYFFRVKQDRQREEDEFIMKELFKYLK